MLEYCTLPRTGALEVILEVLGPDAKSSTNGVANNIQAQGGIHKICDVTIAYPEGKPLDLFQIVFGSRPACVTHVHYRLFDVKDIPSEAESLKQWMYNLYAEKEKMLEDFYRTGIFPHQMYPPASTSKATSPDASERAPRLLNHDPFRFLLLHLFFLTTTAIMYCSVTTLQALLF